MEQTKRLLRFLDASPSCYHAAENLACALTDRGYGELSEGRPWDLTPGGRYFVRRGGASLIAFRFPRGGVTGFAIAAGHSDFPTLKIRERAELSGGGDTMRLSVEPYGGGIWRSWMDRPLSVAGRVAVAEAGRVSTRLVWVDRDLLVIPSVAIHMDRKVNEGTALKANADLLPLFAAGTETGRFRALIAREAGVAEDAVLGTDLYLCPRTPAALLGAGDAFVASPRLDDLQCVFACLEGFLAAEEGRSAPVLCVFHNEEVGSGTRQGADSTFLADVLERICAAAGAERQVALANSFLVSADNAHAVHPNHPEYADPAEQPVLNGGVVLKYNASQRYCTDGMSAAVFRQLCREAGVRVQSYSNRADLPGGSTLGNISAAHVSVPAVDVGLPQLAMHAAYEVGGVRDTGDLIQVMTRYFAAGFRLLEDGSIRIGE